jgi:hypothetical protein
VPADRIYVDHGLTGTNRERSGLHQALVACRGGDTLVVTKLDRLARSLPDACAITGELTERSVRLTSAAPSTTRPTPSSGCCSKSWRWSPNSNPTTSIDAVNAFCAGNLRWSLETTRYIGHGNAWNGLRSGNVTMDAQRTTIGSVETSK